MAGLAEETILALLEEVGRRYSQPAGLLLLEGSILDLHGLGETSTVANKCRQFPT
jgi:hypothetical protein